MSDRTHSSDEPYAGDRAETWTPLPTTISHADIQAFLENVGLIASDIQALRIDSKQVEVDIYYRPNGSRRADLGTNATLTSTVRIPIT